MTLTLPKLRTIRMLLSPSKEGTQGTSCSAQGAVCQLAASAFPSKGPQRSRPQMERSLWNIILASHALYTSSLFCEQSNLFS